MNIVASIHLYHPNHNCGAEAMMHQVLKSLQEKGHNVRVLLNQANHYKITSNYVFDGVDVFPPNPNVVEGLYNWANVIFTHLDYTRWSIHMAAMHKKPVMHFIHNTHLYPEIADAEKTQYVVYNSQWAKDKLNYKWDNMIMTPPVDWRHYDTKVNTMKSQYVTLINVNENKGGKIFTEIARAMPNKQFLGVLGSYDEQVTANLPNLKYISNTVDILDVYKQTRTLLMPSTYESWGRTATEAMCSGIPVISSEAEGLKENCGNAGIYIKNRNDVKEWVEAIAKLDDEKTYFTASKKAKARSREHDPRETLDRFELWLKEKVYSYKH
jgi:glycosyltransferase involved in cell wall biosynthesis